MKKETTFILVGLTLTRVGFGVAWRAAEKATVKTDNTDASLNLESTLSFLKNLNWLQYLANIKRSTLSTKSVPSSKKNHPTPIASKIETRYTVIFGYDGAKLFSGKHGMGIGNCMSIAAMGFLNLWMSAPVVSGKNPLPQGFLSRSEL